MRRFTGHFRKELNVFPQIFQSDSDLKNKYNNIKTILKGIKRTASG